MTHRQQSNLVAFICIIIGVCFFILSFKIKTDGTYPKIVCVALVVLSIISIIENGLEAAREEKNPHRELKEEEMTTEELATHMAKEHEEKVPWMDLIVIIATAFGSLILWKPISFIFAGALAVLVISIYKKRPILKSVILAVCTVVVIQLIFRNIFTIPIPSPSWWPR